MLRTITTVLSAVAFTVGGLMTCVGFITQDDTPMTALGTLLFVLGMVGCVATVRDHSSDEHAKAQP